MKARRERAKEAVRAQRAQQPRRRKWKRWVVLVLLLLLLLMRCECDEPVEGVVDAGLGVAPDVGAVVGDAGPPDAAASRPARRPRRAKVHLVARERPAFGKEAPEPDTWLPAFRLQVAARAPRLARCFEGAERPGALRWSAQLDPGLGLVSDQTFEPVLQGAGLSAARRACLAKVMAEPGYALEGGEGVARVSMVIEF